MLIRILFSILFLITPALSQAAFDSAESDFTPWSGYWWPTNKGGLATGFDYNGHPAPLEKYDYLKDGKYPGPATQWYLDHNYDPDAPHWYGLCGSWASAAVAENISFYPSIIDKILFNVGDKKGLITLSHEYDIAIRANSHPPEVFHSWLLQYIKDQGISFYANLDPGDEIWNYPVYKYEMEILELDSMLSVTTRIWYVDDQVEPDFQGAKVREKLYTYLLYLNGAGGDIIGGEWTGNSAYDHPQQLNLPLVAQNSNPHLDYDFVRTIAVSRDDELESNQVTEMLPGGYKLLLLNVDDYELPADEGDALLLHIAKDEAFGADTVNLQITDADGTIVYANTLNDQVDITIEAQAPPYTLTVTSDNYDSGIVYDVQFDLKKTFVFANTQTLKGWGGFAITNAQEEICERVYVVGYDRNNVPTDTYLGPFSLAPGEKRTVETSDFEVSIVDRDDLRGFKVLASSDLQVVNIFGYPGTNMSCYGSKKNRSRFVIPDSSSKWDFSRIVSWGIYNPTIREQDFTLEFYGAEGDLVDAVSMSLPANKSGDFDSTVSPFTGDKGQGWVLVNVEDDESLQGYTEWLENGITKAEALDSLPVGKEFFVPQIIDTSTWRQAVVLINVGDVANTLTVSLVDGEITQSTVIELLPHQKKTLNVASLFPAVTSTQLNSYAIKIAAQHDMSGFFKFITPGDDLYYPFLDSDNIKQELVLPHVAVNYYWWTGCTLFNPSLETVSLQVLPYDIKGNLLVDQIHEKNLLPHSKDVFTLYSIFGSQSSLISFVKFKVVSGPGITGLFAIGDKDFGRISGTVMH